MWKARCARAAKNTSETRFEQLKSLKENLQKHVQSVYYFGKPVGILTLENGMLTIAIFIQFLTAFFGLYVYKIISCQKSKENHIILQTIPLRIISYDSNFKNYFYFSLCLIIQVCEIVPYIRAPDKVNICISIITTSSPSPMFDHL